MKKKFDGEEYTQKRKKQKVSKSADDTNDDIRTEVSEVRKKKKQKTAKTAENKNDAVKAEVLDVTTLREGMLLLGCVTEIRSNCVLMSLPGCLVGNVPLTNISRKFVDELRRSVAQGDMDDMSLESVVRVGAVYPCKVMHIASQETLKKPIVTISIDPKDVNEDLRLPSLYLKMVVYAVVESVEDHGYVMDMGVRGAQGFLPFTPLCDCSALCVGQVVATAVRKLPSPKSGNVVWLTALSLDEAYPEIESENMKLSSILPGANVTAYVTNVKHPFYYMKCMNYDACANAATLGNTKQVLSEGMRVSGTVLYVHPITRMIYLFLGARPTPQTFEQFFRVKKFDKLKNVKYEFAWHTKLFFKIGKSQLGYARKGELPATGKFSQESLLTTPIVPKARAIFLHYMDNLVQLSFNRTMLNLEIKNPEEVKVGDILEATVKKHVERGMFVQVCPGLSGFVRQVLMSDVLVTMPEKLHPEDSKVKCRVLSKGHPSHLDLTCKESLVSVPEAELLTSYEDAQVGAHYKGVIVQKKDAYLLVLFFNDVKGVVPMEEVPASSLLYVGQTVTCEVLQCDAEKQKLRLSLGGNKSKKPNKPAKAHLTAASISSAEDSTLAAKTHKAIITNITAHQLNIVVEGTMKGRVHITELGSPKENCLPLREFSPGLPLKVHVLGRCDKRTRNFLPISHLMTKHFLECSLEYPPPVPIKGKLRPGVQVTGFVKEIHPTFATLWLTPMCTGTLQYLHFSKNPKVLRKLKKQLKVGLSLNVTVLKYVGKERRQECRSGIMLTKLDKQVIKAGENVVGLVKSASPEEGLVLHLPHDYRGTVGLTDLQDNYAPVDSVLSKSSKLQFVLCHVIEVNHASRSCLLSLRKSRLYRRSGEDSGLVAPEVSVRDVENGRRFKGFVKKCSEDSLVVNFGRMLDGRVLGHSCSALGCKVCKCTREALRRHPVGSVVEVVVDGSSAKDKLYNLLLPELADLESVEPSRLKVAEDIDWDDV